MFILLIFLTTIKNSIIVSFFVISLLFVILSFNKLALGFEFVYGTHFIQTEDGFLFGLWYDLVRMLLYFALLEPHHLQLFLKTQYAPAVFFLQDSCIRFIIVDVQDVVFTIVHVSLN